MLSVPVQTLAPGTSERGDPESPSHETAMAKDVQSERELYKTMSLSPQASQSTEPEKVASIWCDERELQNERWETFNDVLKNVAGGRFSPICATLNASWGDISSTQQRYYMRKAQEAVTASLSVFCPGQGNKLWSSIQNELLIESEDGYLSKRRHFDTSFGLINVLIKVHDEARLWQTKRQILLLFLNDLSRVELQRLTAIEAGKRQAVPEEAIFQTRINPVKVDHFINLFCIQVYFKMLHM